MVSQHIVYLGTAGSGKTTFLLNKGLDIIKKVYPHRILYLTYTIEARKQLTAKKEYLASKQGLSPKYMARIDIFSFFSFLLKFAIRPYLTEIFPELMWVPIRFHHIHSSPDDKKIRKRHYLKKDSLDYYTIKKPRFNSIIIRSDRISDMILHHFPHTPTTIFDLFYQRLKETYSYIFVDEAQDYTGGDLKLFKEFALREEITMVFAGDPRQAIFETDPSKNRRNKKVKHILRWRGDKELKDKIEWDTNSLSSSFRIPQNVIDIVTSLFKDTDEYSDIPITTKSKEEGFCKIIRSKDELKAELVQYKDLTVAQLRYDKTHGTFFPSSEYPIYNFGESKGLEFDIVIIYVPKKFARFIKINAAGRPFFGIKSKDGEITRSRYKLYVALTRARKGVFIVLPSDKNINPNQLSLI